MQTVHTAAELKNLVDAARAAKREIVFVPTMGALHAGHLSLVDLAKQGAAEGHPLVVVSVFVNPLQFGEGEDFDRYPRTLDADAKLLEGRSADVLFAPDVDEVYPNGQEGANHKVAGPAAKILEGAARPGHFDGMLTVVARLFDLVNPDRAIFGAKDAQQLFLVRQMAAKDYPSLIVQAAPTVRETTGLAMSSRNRYLNAEQRDIAEILAIALATVSQLIREGIPASQALSLGSEMISSEPETKLDYLALVDPQTFAVVGDEHSGPALLIVAAYVGGVRLLDNHLFEI